MPPKSSKRYLAILLAAAAWFVISESLETAATGVFLYGGILAPINFLIQNALRALRLGRVLTSLHAFAATWIIASLVFFARKLAPTGAAVIDVSFLVIVWSALFYFYRKEFSSASINIVCSITRSGYSKWDYLYCFFLLPGLFFLVRIGNEVIDGDRVLYFGQLYIDFGVLTGITNLLVASTFLPEDVVYGTGPLSYHWLFFAVPAWHSDLFGREQDMNGVLSLANYLAAIFFYKSFSHLIAILARQFARIRIGAWADAGAIFAIFGLNIRYFHELAFAITGWGVIDPGIRNRLILSFPNSLNAFGYNTFALGLLVVALVSLHYWNKTGNRWHLFMASFWVAWMPIFSATIVPGVAAGIGAACLLKQVRSPWYSLATFTACGATTTIIFKMIGVFGSQSDPPQFSFDGGQFLINCLLSSPLFLLVCFAWLFGWRSQLYKYCVFVGTGLILIPSLMSLGRLTTTSDLSMKNYTAVAVMFGAIVISGLIALKNVPAVSDSRVRLCLILSSALIALGFINSIAYAMSSGIMRFPECAGLLIKVRPPNNLALSRNYFDSLRFARDSSPRSAILVAHPPQLLRDPALIVSGRRPFLANDDFLNRASETTKVQLLDRSARWSDWKRSGFSDEVLAKWFSERTDILVLEGNARSQHWTQKARFGNWGVYTPNAIAN